MNGRPAAEPGAGPPAEAGVEARAAATAEAGAEAGSVAASALAAFREAALQALAEEGRTALSLPSFTPPSERAAVPDEERRMSYRAAREFWAALEQADDEGTLGARSAQHLDLGAGIIGRAIDVGAGAENLQAGLSLLSRSWPAIAAHNRLVVSEDEDHLFVTPQFGPEPHHPIVAQAILATVARVVDAMVDGAPHPVAVRLTSRVSSAAARRTLDELFGGPAHVEQSIDQLVYSREAASRGLPGRAPTWPEARLALARATAAAPLESEHALADRVRAAVLRRLPEPARVHDIAEDLGLSSRTLQRRIAAEHRSFRDLRDEARAAAAAAWLRRGVSVTDTAGKVGFDDLSAFGRWFRQKTGLRPSEVSSAADDDSASGLRNKG